MLARTAFGKTEKYFPSASNNIVSIMQEIIDVIWVFPFAEFLMRIFVSSSIEMPISYL